MTQTKDFTNLQIITLFFLRLLIGWHLLYEGISKLLTPNWSSIGFLRESQWFLSSFAKWITSNEHLLATVDFLNIWGLIAIGVGLILGLFTRAAAVSGTLLLFTYYFNNAPLIGIEYSIPTEGNNLIVSKTLIEAFALLVIAVFPSGKILGLDLLVPRFKSKKNKKNRK